MGNFIGQDASMPVSFKISSLYFRCERTIPFELRPTSRQGKYLIGPKSFIENQDAK